MNPLRCNIYKDALQRAELFGKPVLYTGLPIERESVPDNWYCYDLTGSERNPTKPVTLEERAVWNRVGSVLSPVPLKRETTRARQIKDSFSLHEEQLDLGGFCEENHLDCPCDPRKYVLRPASPGQEAGLFYSLGEPEEDAAAGTIGHVRLDFGGGRLHHTWWPHNEDRLNTPAFKAALQEFVDELRARGPLQSEAAMCRWRYRYPEGEIGRDSVGFVAETADYRFCLRCSASSGDYSYLYCYDLNQQRLAMADAEAKQDLPPFVRGILDRGQEGPESREAVRAAIAGLDAAEREKLDAVIRLAEPESGEEICRLAEHLEQFDFISDVQTLEEYGEYMIQESGQFLYDENLREVYDYRLFGEIWTAREQGEFTDTGYVVYHGVQSLEELMRPGPEQQTKGMEMGGM